MRVPALGGPWAAVAVLMLGRCLAAGDAGAGAWQVGVINFNFETVQVTWDGSAHPGTNLTLSYRFSGEDLTACPDYLLQDGRTAGCVFPARGDQVLSFSLWNGTHAVLTWSRWIAEHLKPSSPQHLQFHWLQEAVTVTCPDLPHRNLWYEVQHKSVFDQEWQSTRRGTCNVTVSGLDADRCYVFRARVAPMESSYGPDTHPSDWSPLSRWRGGEPRDSCQEEAPPAFDVYKMKFVFFYGLAAVLAMVLLPVSLWKLRRVKKLLVPRVPDPKVTFPGLFESHRGDFQEWMRDTQDVTVLPKPDAGTQDPVWEEAVVVQPPKAAPETPRAALTRPLLPWALDTEATGDPDPRPSQGPPGETRVQVGDFVFTVSEDDAYVML